MKCFTKVTVRFVLALSIISTSLTSIGAQNDKQGPEIRVSDSKILDAGEASSRLSELRKGKAGAALDAYLQKEGFSPHQGRDAFFGADIFFKSNDDKQAKVTVLLQDYVSQSTGKHDLDHAAIAFTTSSSGGQSKTYAFLLLLRGTSDPAKSVEYYVDDQNNVVPAHSWWTCLYTTLRSRCGPSCSASVSSCSVAFTSFAAFLNCIVQRAGCAGCVLGAMACCTCNCNWWCSWACGCCRS